MKVRRRYVTVDESTITLQKHCLGALQCPFPGCRWARRPPTAEQTDQSKATLKSLNTKEQSSAAVTAKSLEWPEEERSEEELKDDPEDDVCLTHKLLPEHIPCSAYMDLVESEGSIKFTHYNYHQHRVPLPKRASQDALQYLDTLVSTAPDTRPKHLLHQTEHRNPISQMYPVFRNLSYLRYRRNKVLHKYRNPNNLGQLAAMEEVFGSCFIRSSSIRSFDGHISVQTTFIQQHCQDLVSSMQSDSVHGIITDDHFADVNVAFTSALCPILQRTIPMIMSILFGRSSVHYKQHFLALFKSLPYDDWADFDENFPGMTCDFADAERIGFRDAVLEHYQIPDNDFIPERHYGFCAVHYERSVVRVRRNGAIIPHMRQMEFYNAAMALTSSSLSHLEFEQSIAQVKAAFPKSKPWLDFYLQEDRARVVFPASSSIQPKPPKPPKPTISKDTNAQESLGGDFKAFVKRTTPTCSIIQGVSAITRYQESFFADFDFASQGGTLRYRDTRKANPTSRSRSSMVSARSRRNVASLKLLAEHNRFLPERPVVNTRYSNDGRAPDTTDKLLSRRTRSGIELKVNAIRGVGRPKGSRNRIPTIASVGDLDWTTFGIPWRRQKPVKGQFTFENSCPVDTTLMAWFLLSRYAGATLPTQVAATKEGQTLLRVMEEVRATRYDYARELWCTEAMGLANDRHHDLYKSLEDVFLDRLPSLTRFEASRTTECSRSGCPPKVNQLTPRAVVMLTPDTITQDTFDRSWRHQYDNTCSVRIGVSGRDNSDMISEDTRLEVLNDVDGEPQFWYACTGRRVSKESVMLVTYPYLLVLDCLQAAHETDGEARTPPALLNLVGESYKLGAILYSNGSHFCCTVFVASGAFIYDGIDKKRCLRHVTLEELRHPARFRIIHVWYIRDRPTEDPPAKDVTHSNGKQLEQEETFGVGTSVVGTGDPIQQRTSLNNASNSLVNSHVPRRSQRRGCNPAVSVNQDVTKSHSKKRHPIGLSVCPVSSKGKRPVCGACKEELERDSMRFVLTTIFSEPRVRVDSVSYHFTQKCMQALPQEHHPKAQSALDEEE